MNLIALEIMTTVNVSISIPRDLLHDIDKKRGDVPRSKYCRNLILKALESGTKKGGSSK